MSTLQYPEVVELINEHLTTYNDERRREDAEKMYGVFKKLQDNNQNQQNTQSPQTE